MEPLRKREGDVWDRRQESRLLIGEPVCLKRLAGGWCYVISDSTEGYAKEDGIFICTKRHYEKYRELVKREFQVAIKPGRYRDGQYFRVGTVLPLFDEEQKLDICRKQGPEAAPCRLREGTGRGCTPVLIRSYLPFTERQIRLQAERMLGIPYSWGDERLDGMDCASTVRGLYA